jgi:cytochrome P450
MKIDLGRMNLSAEIFGPGAEVFNPERFMVDEKEKARLVGLNTFGGGARHCM